MSGAAHSALASEGGPPERLHPLVVRVTAPNPSAYTATGTQTYIVGSGADRVVIDPGPAGGGARWDNGEGHVEAILAACQGARVSAILVTHTHRDHSPAAAPLALATGAPVIGCAPLDPAGEGAGDAAFDRDYRPDHILHDGERIAGDGWTVQAVATPGHTSNHLCFALPEAGALFTGDHVMAWSTSVVSPPDGDMGAYLASLEKLIGRSERVFYPGHGPVAERPQQLLRGMIGHRRQRERQILRELDQGPRSVEALVAANYKGLDPRLHGAAARTVYAHLIDLGRRGLVAADGPAGEEALWALV